MLGAPPNAVEHPQKIFVFVASSTWTSSPIKMYLGDIYTISVNLAGLPGMTVPCGKDDKGLPIGVQLIGDCFQEKKIIKAAYTYEQCAGKERD